MNKSDFDHIVIQKKKNRDKLDELKISLSVFIYTCLIYGKSLKEILKGSSQLVKDVNLSHLSALNARTQAIAKRSYKLSQMPNNSRKIAVFEAVTKSGLFDAWDKAAAETLNKIETDMKDEVYKESLSEPSEIENIRKEKCFVLASRHDDCAEDHKPYQGKIYVKKWALRYKVVKDYCFAHDIQTVEWVMGEPAWLTTRPNCRHFFKDVSLEDIEGTKREVLLKENGMDRVAGSKGAWKNIRHSTRKQWYTEENIERIIKKYKDRLKTHEKMARVATNENLENLINKDKLLISKWEAYLADLREK